MSNFIKAIAMQLKDRQEFEFNAKKIGEDLVLMIQCDKKGSGKVLNITVPAADLETEIDAKIIEEINRPDQKKEKPAVQETPKEVDTTKEQFEAAMTEGKRLFDERKYQEAAESYKKATELNPESEPAKKLLANAERWVKQMNNIKTA